MYLVQICPNHHITKSCWDDLHINIYHDFPIIIVDIMSIESAVSYKSGGKSVNGRKENTVSNHRPPANNPS